MKKTALLLLTPGVLGALWFVLRPAGPPAADTAAAGPTPMMRTETATRVTPDRPGRSAPARTSRPDDITLALQTNNAADREWVWNELLPELVRRDAAAAGRLAETWESGPLRDELLRQVARRWAAADIGGAVAWLMGLEDHADLAVAAGSTAAEIARTDPAGAAEVAQYFHTGLDDGSLEHRVQLWTEEKPAEAVNWITGRPAGPERDRLLARIAYVRVQSEPDEALVLVLHYMSAGTTRNDALAAVARQWAMRDPAGATAWAGELPAGELRTRVLAAVETGRR